MIDWYEYGSGSRKSTVFAWFIAYPTHIYIRYVTCIYIRIQYVDYMCTVETIIMAAQQCLLLFTISFTKLKVLVNVTWYQYIYTHTLHLCTKSEFDFIAQDDIAMLKTYIHAQCI